MVFAHLALKSGGHETILTSFSLVDIGPFEKTTRLDLACLPMRRLSHVCNRRTNSHPCSYWPLTEIIFGVHLAVTLLSLIYAFASICCYMLSFRVLRFPYQHISSALFRTSVVGANRGEPSFVQDQEIQRQL